jgi:hypothetical protein
MKNTVPQQVVCTAQEDPSGREYRNIGLMGVPQKGDSLVIQDDSTPEGGSTFIIEDVVHRSIHSVAALHLRIRRFESAGVTAKLRPKVK